MQTQTQEFLALSVVGIAGVSMLWTLFKKYLAGRAAQLLLNRGHVKWAFKLKRLARNIRST